MKAQKTFETIIYILFAISLYALSVNIGYEISRVLAWLK